MNCSDNVSSDAVLPEENIFAVCQTGMGYSHINQFLPMMQWNGNDPVINYDPNASFRDVFSHVVIIPSSCVYAGGQK